MTDIQEHGTVAIGSERSFGIVFAAVFAVVGLLPLLDGAAPRPWALAVAAAFLAVALLRPRLLAPANRAWFRLGMLLGAIVTPVVMALVFFIAVTPTALLLRLFGKDPLNRRFDPDAPSYWIPRDAEADARSSMSNQF
ncbi:MAG TPA: SxtJ family membrane protein [Thalassobaculum sp.]